MAPAMPLPQNITERNSGHRSGERSRSQRAAQVTRSQPVTWAGSPPSRRGIVLPQRQPNTTRLRPIEVAPPAVIRRLLEALERFECRERKAS